MSIRFSKVLLLLVIAATTVGAFSAFADGVLATTDVPLVTYFARIQPTVVYQLINEAAIWFGEQKLAGTEYEGLPIITRQSTVHGGFRGADDFLNFPVGYITIDSVKQFCRYTNTVAALKLNGRQIIEWLEASAGNFNQIDPSSTDDQYLLNNEFDPHKLDQFWGISYMFDVTQPLGSRVDIATYKGVALSEDMEFIVISDNYRAGGGANMPNAQPENIVLKWEDITYPELVADYLSSRNGRVSELVINWSIKPVDTAGRVILRTGPEWGVPVADYMDVAAALNIEPVGHIELFGTEDVWGLFVVDLAGVTTPLR